MKKADQAVQLAMKRTDEAASKAMEQIKEENLIAAGISPLWCRTIDKRTYNDFVAPRLGRDVGLSSMRPTRL